MFYTGKCVHNLIHRRVKRTMNTIQSLASKNDKILTHFAFTMIIFCHLRVTREWMLHDARNRGKVFNEGVLLFMRETHRQRSEKVCVATSAGARYRSHAWIAVRVTR